jgi:DNA-binding transcriptional ArsR family regulator
MTVATLSAEVGGALWELAWEQWSQLGLSAAPPAQREERAADPEALLLFTLHVGRYDPRLFDEVLGWLALNTPLISTQRLRNLCTDATDRALANAALDWAASARRRTRPAGVGTQPPTDGLEPLFHDLPVLGDARDPAFSRHGFARPPLTASGKSQPPRLHDPISFALRLRRLLGVGVRAEVVRILLTIRAPRLSSGVITANAGFDQRNVREGLTQLHEAGVVDVVRVSEDRHYSIRLSDWATLLHLPSAPDLPLHYDWIPAYRALTQILRWLRQPELDELSPYLLASQARTLLDDIAQDLSYAGIPAGLHSAHGADAFEQLISITRTAITNVRHNR